MGGTSILNSTEAITQLALLLERCPSVSQVDNGTDEPESWMLAYTLSHLEESFRNFLDVRLPALVEAGGDETKTFEALHAIGEDLRHILYHLRDSTYFRYIDTDPRA